MVIVNDDDDDDWDKIGYNLNFSRDIFLHNLLREVSSQKNVVLAWLFHP